MSSNATSGAAIAAAGVTGGSAGARAARAASRGTLNFVVGLAILAVLWGIGGYFIAANPKTAGFAGFGLPADIVLAPGCLSQLRLGSRSEYSWDGWRGFAS